MRFAKLTLIVGERAEAGSGEDDQPQTMVETTEPMLLNLEAVKSLYPRKPSYMGTPRAGTRINYTMGGGIAVQEDFEAVAALFSSH